MCCRRRRWWKFWNKGKKSCRTHLHLMWLKCERFVQKKIWWAIEMVNNMEEVLLPTICPLGPIPAYHHHPRPILLSMSTVPTLGVVVAEIHFFLAQTFTKCNNLFNNNLSPLPKSNSSCNNRRYSSNNKWVSIFPLSPTFSFPSFLVYKTKHNKYLWLTFSSFHPHSNINILLKSVANNWSKPCKTCRNSFRWDECNTVYIFFVTCVIIQNSFSSWIFSNNLTYFKTGIRRNPPGLSSS